MVKGDLLQNPKRDHLLRELSHKLAVRPEKEADSLAELLSSGALPESQTLSQCQKHIERESENGGGAKGKGERMRRKPPAAAVALTRWPAAGAKREHTLVKRKRVRREKGVKEKFDFKILDYFSRFVCGHPSSMYLSNFIGCLRRDNHSPSVFMFIVYFNY